MHALPFLLAVVAVLPSCQAARARPNDSYSPARRTPSAGDSGYGEGTSPAPTSAPRLRLRNGNLELRAAPNTCGFMSDARATVPKPFICYSDCQTDGSWIGCESPPATVCLDGGHSLCRSGVSRGPRTLCCVGSTAGWQPYCVDYTKKDPSGYKTLRGCWADALMSDLDSNSAYLVPETRDIVMPASTTSTPPSPTTVAVSVSVVISVSTYIPSQLSGLGQSLTAPSLLGVTYTLTSALGPSPASGVEVLGLSSSPNASPAPASATAESDAANAPAPAQASAGTIAGGVVGAIAVVALTVCVVAWLVMRRKRASRRGDVQPHPGQPGMMQPYVVAQAGHAEVYDYPSKATPAPSYRQSLAAKAADSAAIYEVTPPPVKSAMAAAGPTSAVYEVVPPPVAHAMMTDAPAPAPTVDEVTPPVQAAEVRDGPAPAVFEAPAVNATGTGNNPAQLSGAAANATGMDDNRASTVYNRASTIYEVQALNATGTGNHPAQLSGVAVSTSGPEAVPVPRVYEVAAVNATGTGNNPAQLGGGERNQ